MSTAGLGLIGDVGATNARFALVRPDGIMTAARMYVLNDYASLTDLVDAYLAQESARPEQAVLAVASPITGDRVTLTNIRGHSRLRPCANPSGLSGCA